MIWLGIDTSNTPLSVALVKDGKVLIEDTSTIPVNHSLRAMAAIEEIFAKAKLKPQDIDGIAVAEGPGSYTGVRIGVTIAKTLAWTLDKKLVGVSSIKALALNAALFNGIICPIIDARRNHVYSGAYKMIDNELTSIITDGHYSLEALAVELSKQNEPILLTGIDAPLFKKELSQLIKIPVTITFYPQRIPSASSVIYLAEAVSQEDSGYHFVPKYHRIAEAEANWLKAQKKDR